MLPSPRRLCTWIRKRAPSVGPAPERLAWTTDVRYFERTVAFVSTPLQALSLSLPKLALCEHRTLSLLRSSHGKPRWWALTLRRLYIDGALTIKSTTSNVSACGLFIPPRSIMGPDPSDFWADDATDDSTDDLETVAFVCEDPFCTGSFSPLWYCGKCSCTYCG